MSTVLSALNTTSILCVYAQYMTDSKNKMNRSTSHDAKPPHAVFMHEDRVILSTNVERLRTSQGLDTQRLAQMAGVSRQTIHCIETLNVDPKLSTLRKIAAALDVSIADLFKIPEDKPSRRDHL